MDYPGDDFHTFSPSNLDSVIYLEINGTVTSLPVFYLKYLKLCYEEETKLLWSRNDMWVS